MAATTKPGSKLRDLIALLVALVLLVALFWAGSKALDYLLIGSTCRSAREDLVDAQRAIDVYGETYDRQIDVISAQADITGYCKD